MISIIIPCYNAEKTILRCLSSILEGSFRDFEILLCDDASQDQTLSLVRSLADPRIRILPSAENGGVSRARNRGLEEAAGKYVTFIDADDSVTPDYLEVLHGFAESHGTDWTLTGFRIVNEDDPGQVILSRPMLFDRDTVIRGEALSSVLPALIFHNGERCTAASVWGGLLRRDIIEKEHLRFHEGLRYGEDTLFNLYYSVHCSSLGFAAGERYRYHQHGGTSTDALFRRYTIGRFVLQTEAVEAFRRTNGVPLLPAQSNYFFSQSFGFLNQNALLKKDRSERKAYYETLRTGYWNSPAVQELWKGMKISDIRGRIQQIRFFLMKRKAYPVLVLMQRLIGLVKRH